MFIIVGAIYFGHIYLSAFFSKFGFSTFYIAQICSGGRNVFQSENVYFGFLLNWSEMLGFTLLFALIGIIHAVRKYRRA